MLFYQGYVGRSAPVQNKRGKLIVLQFVIYHFRYRTGKQYILNCMVTSVSLLNCVHAQNNKNEITRDKK